MGSAEELNNVICELMNMIDIEDSDELLQQKCQMSLFWRLTAVLWILNL